MDAMELLRPIVGYLCKDQSLWILELLYRYHHVMPRAQVDMALKVAIFMTLHSHLYFFLALFLITEKTQPVNTPGFRRLPSDEIEVKFTYRQRHRLAVVYIHKSWWYDYKGVMQGKEE